MAKKQVKESAPKLSSESTKSKPPVSKHRTTARTKPVSSLSEPAVAVAVVETIVSPAASHDDIAKLAYSYWLERGCQGGSPEEDWTRAERELLGK
jgi:hypothetical protein